MCVIRTNLCVLLCAYFPISVDQQSSLDHAISTLNQWLYMLNLSVCAQVCTPKWLYTICD